MLTVSHRHPYVTDHKFGGRCILSAAFQLGCLLRAARTSPAVRLRSVAFMGTTTVGENLELLVDRKEDRLTLLVAERKIARATYEPSLVPVPQYEHLDDLCLDEVTPAFRQWRDHDCAMEYGPAYDVTRSVRGSSRRVVSLLDERYQADADELIPAPYLDAVFQLVSYLSGAPHGGGLPWTIKQVDVLGVVRGPVYADVELVGPADQLHGRARIVTRQGEPMATLEGIRLRAPDPPTEQVAPSHAHTIEWHTLFLDSEPSNVDPIPTIEAPEEPVNVTGALFDLAEEVKTALRRHSRFRVISRSPTLSTGTCRLAPFAAAVGALLRSVRAEHPRHMIQWINYPSGAPIGSPPTPEQATEAVADATGWLAPKAAALPPQGYATKLAGHWLVIGGLGGVARSLTPQFHKLGCTRLTLMSRHEPSAESMRFIQAWQEEVDATHIRADIASDDFRWPHFDYDVIVNAAGALDDALFVRTTKQQIEKVWAPKLHGTRRMGEYLTVRPDATMISFSSVAAIDGNTGQAVYASANAYQDAQAEAMRHAGAAWYSLAWGLWDVGMGEPLHQRAREAGYPIIDATKGSRLFDEALTREPRTYVLRDFPLVIPRPGTAPEQRQEACMLPTKPNPTHQVCQALAKVLERDEVSPHDSPEDLGLDSMMAVEASALLADQGMEIEPADFFGYATVLDIAKQADSSARDDTDPVARSTANEKTSATTPRHPHPQESSEPVAAPAPLLDEPRQPKRPQLQRTQPQQTPEPQDATVAAPEHSLRPNPSDSGWSDPGTLSDPTRVGFARSLPSTLTALKDGSPLAPIINEISAEDRQLVAEGAYFYEPVIEESSGAHIKVEGRWMLNLASYSYLGLIKNEFIDARSARELHRSGTAAHGVRLLSGTSTVHRQLEQRIAQFLGREDTIVFSSGYMANVATIAALVQPGDVVLGDSLNHASIVDGCKLSGAEFRSYAHNDARDLRRGLENAHGRRTLVVTDAVFSMDGDVADLPAIVTACRGHGAALMVDEAHSIGVLGRTGRGIAEHFNLPPDCIDVAMGTLSKTVPSAGGYVSGSNDLIFAMKNGARGWMFSAAVPPAQAAAADAAFELIAAAPQRVDRLRALTEDYRAQLHSLGFSTMKSTTPIVPVRCATAEQTVALARRCQERGLFVQPITYPTVPKTTPRLRTIVNLDHTPEDLSHAVRIIAESAREIPVVQ